MSAQFPPHPLAPPSKPRRRVWPWILGGLLLLLVVLVACNSAATSAGWHAATNPGDGFTGLPSTAQSSAATIAAKAAKALPSATVTEGTYQVGVDVAAGRYKTTGPATHDPDDECYWARNRDDSGDSIIANAILRGPGSVTVKAGEFLELSGGCTWIRQ